jgi:hypothetical protein
MAAHEPAGSGGVGPAGEPGMSFDDGAQSERGEEPADLWSLPRDVVAAPPATDTLLAAWAGALTQGGDVETSPDREWAAADAAGHRAPDPPTRHRVKPRRSGLTTTLLASAVVSAVACLAAFPVIGLMTADIRIDQQVGDTPSPATDDRVVVRGPADGCLTMLVKPRRTGSTTNVNGTCFFVG